MINKVHYEINIESEINKYKSNKKGFFSKKRKKIELNLMQIWKICIMELMDLIIIKMLKKGVVIRDH